MACKYIGFPSIKKTFLSFFAEFPFFDVLCCMNAPTSTTEIRNNLRLWYLQHRRPLPWREDNDPYRVWLSEIILQQTRVAQGASYFEKIVQAYPDVIRLANAPIDELLKHWQGLGYYSRARNLHETARTIRDQYNGVFPADYRQILALKGVGSYTAAAIASIAFNQAKAVLDGNVYRVLSRLYADSTPIKTTSGQKHFQHLADALLDTTEPGLHNQAVMDFGAMQCTPNQPDCTNCTLSMYCQAHQTNQATQFPVTIQPKPKRNRFFLYFLIEHNKEILVQQRGASDVWQGLWDFVHIETAQHPVDSFDSITQLESFASGPFVIHNTYQRKQTLSHQVIHAQFIRCSCTYKKQIASNQQWIPLDALHRLPVPVLIDCAIRHFYT